MSSQMQMIHFASVKISGREYGLSMYHDDDDRDFYLTCVRMLGAEELEYGVEFEYPDKHGLCTCHFSGGAWKDDEFYDLYDLEHDYHNFTEFMSFKKDEDIDKYEYSSPIKRDVVFIAQQIIKGKIEFQSEEISYEEE